ncbi:SUMF1/EgtB/PvdO family nonheme iron enzyme [Rhizobium sp. RU36D]|uniref:SUMF1/EgtB/PvdO family nonheme iron enzyme n=1 Tax=Rhizobium sp. RU36D TaxID=1907415 RepID=UPI0009D81F20|nr:SUMF1/EgtB/PvdO family nonheme iron enzyme [Rhizobium sp. RU36D]SMC49445.1 iron(II)-dependent oxidoreductase [Rhizobium sp. RU36D]
MSDTTQGLDALLAAERAFGAEPLLALADGSVIDLATGYIPLLVNFTVEDKAAKGLRKLTEKAEPQPAVYFSALEMTAAHPALVLTGETGSGKTSFARNLAFRLSGGQSPASPIPLPRNEDGLLQAEDCEMGEVRPIYLAVQASKTFAELIDSALPGAVEPDGATLLVILDGIEAAGDRGLELLTDAIAFQKRYARVRMLALGETSVVKSWTLPPDIVRYDLLPLLLFQRRQAAMRLAGLDLDASGIALGSAAANPAQFIMALQAGDVGETAETITDRWLPRTAADNEAIDRLCARAFAALAGHDADQTVPTVTRVRQLLAARHLAGEPAALATEHFRGQPSVWAPSLRSLAARLAGQPAGAALIDALLEGEGGDAVLRGALLAADLETDAGAQRDRIAAHLLTIIQEGALSAPEREQAARFLARWGDPRDLEELADVPGGSFTFGSDTHPNSAPPHVVVVDAFRIGIYPVTNGAYGRFVQETGRSWRSPDGFAEERATAPATDLTWRDARAYCEWLTARWRAAGRIAEDEIVRLPTEPEWERAARGDQPDMGPNTIVYPWGTAWIEDAANSEEAGFNNTCAVGLFPKGRSPYGCYDMAGQVWEWATTLWGDDMATPSFRYPYRDDGREAPDAGPTIRRVLRGGCFSSGLAKACCTYRGSLEPDGFWRGNGFRIVVSRNVRPPD